MDLFGAGVVEVTPAAGAALASAGVDPARFLARHRRGDWGAVEAERRDRNEFALRHGHTLLSRYTLADGTALLVVTAPDRSRTRLLLAAEQEAREVDAREGYAVWAASYDTFGNPLIAVEEPHVERLIADLPITAALDAGAGTGRHALRLARRGVAVTALDQSPEMLGVARKAARTAGLPIRFLVASLERRLPFRAGAFDVLVCALALCHVADLAGAVREFGRALRPGGHLLLTDFHPDAVGRGWRTDFSDLGVKYRLPNMPHTRADYLDAVAAAGLDVLTTLDLFVRDVPDGYLADAIMRESGDLSLCLIVLARKPASARP